MQLQSLLFTVRIVFVMLLSFALACKEDTKNTNVLIDNGKTNPSRAAANSESSDALSEDIVKQVFAKQANSSANQSGSTEAKPASVTFQSIQFGITRKANIKDESEGVPPGATMHPVRVKYTVVTNFAGKERENKYDEDYYLYKDKFGAWARLSMKAGPIK
jgi:hypothetical protein